MSIHRFGHSDESPSFRRLYNFSLEVEDDLSVGAYVLRNSTPVAMSYTANIVLDLVNSTNSQSSATKELAVGKEIYFAMTFAAVIWLDLYSAGY